jgi:general secretion pathway protein G
MKKKGFTLIELLIVVAIIAILAAIAVPNFLEAQVRSKVSRMKADMRTVTTALESYFVDENHYPKTTYNGVFPSPPTFESNERWKVWPGALTTPIAYIASDAALVDIFRKSHGWQSVLANQIMWLPSKFYFPPYNPDTGAFGRQCNRYGLWKILSAGPDTWYQNQDGVEGDYGEGAGSTGWGQAGYDPTNGTVSNGDIYRSQKNADEWHN